MSDYIFLTRKRGLNISFLEFLERLELQVEGGSVFKSDFDNWPMYTIDDVIVVDFVGRFEHLQTDLKVVLAKIGIEVNDAMLPHLNRSPELYNYRNFYASSREQEIVEKLFAKEIGYFGYTF